MASSAAENVVDGVDHFDRLPDAILLLIFNQIGDVKTLARCSAVSRRFHALIPLVHYVVIGADCFIPALPRPSSTPDKPRGVLSRLLRGGIHALTRFRGPNSKPRPPTSSLSPAKVLRNFREIRRLRIVKPAREIAVHDGVLLKWIGSSLESLVIIGASSVHSSTAATSPVASSGDDGGETLPEAFYGSFSVTVMWSLFAAWSRHINLKSIIADCGDTLQSLDFTDADGQGVLTMDRRQLQELHVHPVFERGPSQQTAVHIPNTHFWYAPRLDLPGGIVLEGATLFAVWPREEWNRDAPGSGPMDWVFNGFEEPYRTAARMLLKRRCYCGQQMNL